MTNTIGLFYGSDTGITEDITNRLEKLWTLTPLDIHRIEDYTAEDFQKYDILILGLSTWYYGELQSDWEDFFDQFKTIDFTGKTIALYGLGDQYGYDLYFVDGMGILGQVILANGGTLIGYTSTETYDHEESKAEIIDGMFCGLAIDDDNQPKSTDVRLQNWVRQLEEELKDLV
ncbi:MAG: flavodoxin [Weeksellaceae bacterium]